MPVFIIVMVVELVKKVNVSFSSPFWFIYLFWLIYNVVVIFNSTTKWVSYTYIYIHIYYIYIFFFRFFPIISHYKILSIVLCAIHWLDPCLPILYIVVFLYLFRTPSFPLPPTPANPFHNCKFVLYVCVSSSVLLISSFI